MKAMCEIQLKDSKKVKDLMLMSGLNKVIGELVIAKRVNREGLVLRNKDGVVLRRALEPKFVSQRKKWRPKRTWKNLI